MAPLECLGDFFGSRRKRAEPLALPWVLIQASRKLPDGSPAAQPGEGHSDRAPVPKGGESVGREDPPPPMSVNNGKYFWLNYLPSFFGRFHVAKSIAFFQLES